MNDGGYEFEEVINELKKIIIIHVRSAILVIVIKKKEIKTLFFFSVINSSIL